METFSVFFMFLGISVSVLTAVEQQSLYALFILTVRNIKRWTEASECVNWLGLKGVSCLITVAPCTRINLVKMLGISSSVCV